MRKKTIRDVDVSGRRVLVRVDFNVPLGPGGEIADDTRLRATLPTLRALAERGARIVLVSHLGRPSGQWAATYSLAPVAERLGELLGRPVTFADDCVGEAAEAAAERLGPGEALLLENVRFHAGEETNDPDFAAQLARLGDVYVNDAFGTAHRAHASTAGVAAHLPAVAGLLMEKEIEALSRALEAPRRPFVAIVGGSKVSTKIAVLENLLPRVDRLLIGGAMAFTFLAARGCRTGQSLVERDQIGRAGAIFARGAAKIALPVDVVGAPDSAPGSATTIVDACAIPDTLRGLDVGPRTVEQWSEITRGAGTVVWNGPLGYYEDERFAAGTRRLLEALSDGDATTIVGGGDIVAAIEEAGYADRIDHVSTGGGASLEFLEGRVLPGVAALADR